MGFVSPGGKGIFDANPAACSFYGYSHEELTSLKITDINQMDSEQIFDLMKKAKTRRKNPLFSSTSWQMETYATLRYTRTNNS